MRLTLFLITLVIFFANSTLAVAEDCPEPPCKITVKRPDLAATVGGTAAAGLFAAPFGLESALTSMGIAGGMSIITESITNSNQKMFIKLQNRAAKAVKKNRTDLPCKNVIEGKYLEGYGSCKANPDAFELTKAEEKMASAYYMTFDDAVHAALVLSDGTITLFDESAKRVMCNGNIKAGSYGKTIILYCLDADGRFCNTSYQLTEKAK